MRAPAHTTLNVQQFLTKNGMIPIPYPCYSPNFAPSNLFLFPWMKKVLKGKHFANMEKVKQKPAETLKGIKIKNCFEQWKKSLFRSIASNGEYFEGTEV